MILYHKLSALASNSLLLSSRQIPDFRWDYYNTFSQINQGVSLVWNPQFIAVWNWHAVPYGINTECCMESSRRGTRNTAWRLIPYADEPRCHTVRRAHWFHTKPAAWITKKELLQDKSSFLLAGVARFELTNEGVKVPCLTAWRYPYICSCVSASLPHAVDYSIKGSGCQVFYFLFYYISPVACISSTRRVVYHQCGALYIIITEF